MGKTNAITVKVSSELKEQMKQVKVNWSQYIREAIQKKIDEQKFKTASTKINHFRMRAKPVRTDELVSWNPRRQGKIKGSAICCGRVNSLFFAYYP